MERKKARQKRKQSKHETLGGFIELKYKDWALSHQKRGNETLRLLESSFKHLYTKKLKDITAWDMQKWRSEKDKKGFLRKALNMSQIIAWSRQMEAKHALFLFDSCFSGAIFKTKALPKTPPHINAHTSSPVRQYITAGSAGEEVPASSVFTPSFVRALEGEADLNGDGLVTVTDFLLLRGDLNQPPGPSGVVP